jgi:hypothetical protein
MRRMKVSAPFQSQIDEMSLDDAKPKLEEYQNYDTTSPFSRKTYRSIVPSLQRRLLFTNDGCELAEGEMTEIQPLLLAALIGEACIRNYLLFVRLAKDRTIINLSVSASAVPVLPLEGSGVI